MKDSKPRFRSSLSALLVALVSAAMLASSACTPSQLGRTSSVELPQKWKDEDNAQNLSILKHALKTLDEDLMRQLYRYASYKSTLASNKQTDRWGLGFCGSLIVGTLGGAALVSSGAPLIGGLLTIIALPGVMIWRFLKRPSTPEAKTCEAMKEGTLPPKTAEELLAEHLAETADDPRFPKQTTIAALEGRQDLEYSVEKILSELVVVEQTQSSFQHGPLAHHLKEHYGTLFVAHYPELEELESQKLFIGLGAEKHPLSPKTGRPDLSEAPYRELVVINSSGGIVFAQNLFEIAGKRTTMTVDKAGVFRALQDVEWFDTSLLNAETEDDKGVEELSSELHLKIIDAVVAHLATNQQDPTVLALPPSAAVPVNFSEQPEAAPASTQEQDLTN